MRGTGDTGSRKLRCILWTRSPTHVHARVTLLHNVSAGSRTYVRENAVSLLCTHTYRPILTRAVTDVHIQCMHISTAEKRKGASHIVSRAEQRDIRPSIFLSVCIIYTYVQTYTYIDVYTYIYLPISTLMMCVNRVPYLCKIRGDTAWICTCI